MLTVEKEANERISNEHILNHRSKSNSRSRIVGLVLNFEVRLAASGVSSTQARSRFVFLYYIRLFSPTSAKISRSPRLRVQRRITRKFLVLIDGIRQVTLAHSAAGHCLSKDRSLQAAFTMQRIRTPTWIKKHYTLPGS